MLCISLIKIWNFANQMKKQNKKHQNTKSIAERLKFKGLMFFVSFFYVVCKISNFIMQTAKGWGTLCTKEHFTPRNILLLKSWTHLAAQHTWQSHNLLLSTPCSLTPFATQNSLLLTTPCSLTHRIWQIQLWCPRSKWNMGEILAFLA